MAIFTGNTGSDSGDPELLMDINTTPLIDVMLVLLVMLIITIPIQLHAVDTALPTGTAPSTLTKVEKIEINIDAQSVIHWQGVAISAQHLEEKLGDFSHMLEQPEIHIRPDKNSSYATFTNVLASSRRQGLNKVAILGSDQFKP